jgi:hypothetical protein
VRRPALDRSPLLSPHELYRGVRFCVDVLAAAGYRDERRQQAGGDREAESDRQAVGERPGNQLREKLRPLKYAA